MSQVLRAAWARPQAGPWWRVLLSPGGWIALGMLVRVVYSLILGNEYFFRDTAEYEQVALRFLHGIGSGEIPRAPLYPLLLAASFVLGGEENFAVARLIQLGLALIQMLLTVRLATRIGGKAAGAFAAPLVAFTPTNVFITGLLYPTLLYSTLLLAITSAAWELAERPRARVGVLLGVLVVLGWLTDMVILAPALAVGAWLLAMVRREPRAMLRGLGAAALTITVLLVPYMKWLSAGGQDRVFMGKAQAVLHSARTDPILARYRWVRFPPDTPFEALSVSGFLRREARLLRARPWPYLHDYTREFLHFFQPLPDRVTTQNRFNQPLVLWIGAAWYLLLLPTAVLGLLRGHAPWRARILLAAVVLMTAAFYAFFFTQARYRVPVNPQTIVLASFALAAAFPRLGRLWADPSAGEAAVR